jgi:hypothetical protein
MKINSRAFLKLAGLALLTWAAGLPGLEAQQPLPPEIAALFPANVINPGGIYMKTPSMVVDISGDVPNTRACSKGDSAGTGSMRIQLMFFQGERAPLIQTYARNLRHFIDQEKAGMTPGPVHEEEVAGVTALWVEETGPCVQSENANSHSVDLKCQFVQGQVYGKIGIGFLGDVAEAKAMLAETLDKISKTDWSK